MTFKMKIYILTNETTLGGGKQRIYLNTDTRENDARFINKTN
jgi:hypothetical protein